MQIRSSINSLFSTLKSFSSNLLKPVKKTLTSLGLSRAEKTALHTESQGLGEKCGVFGIVRLTKPKHINNKKHKLAFPNLIQALGRLQHRGQQATGYIASDGKSLKDPIKGPGMISEVFADPEVNKNLYDGRIFMGHTLYGTSKAGKTKKNQINHVQPIVVGKDDQRIALVHNGNLPDCSKLRNFLKYKAKYNDKEIKKLNDSELMAHAISYYYQKGDSLQESVEKASVEFHGGFAILVMDKDHLVAMRDPRAIRPLIMGRTDDDSIVFASETAAFRPIYAKRIKDLDPGEMIVVDKKGKYQSKNFIEDVKKKVDVFEYVYFSRTDSEIEGISVHQARRRAGLELAKRLKGKLKADYIIPVPESGNAAATGFAEGMEIPINMAIIKNRHKRTFIEDGKGLEDKYSVINESIAAKKIIVVDDSIVRGKTTEKLIKQLKEANPAEIHIVSASPPILFPDFYGIDTPKKEDLIAYRNLALNKQSEIDIEKTISNVGQQLGVDSLNYLSIDELVKSIDPSGKMKDQLNLSCFNARYPVHIGSENAKKVGERYMNTDMTYAQAM